MIIIREELVVEFSPDDVDEILREKAEELMKEYSCELTLSERNKDVYPSVIYRGKKVIHSE